MKTLHRFKKTDGVAREERNGASRLIKAGHMWDLNLC